MVKTALTISMTTRRLHLDPRAFGRREPFIDDETVAARPVLSEDMKLFLTTYAAGFMFVSLFIA